MTALYADLMATPLFLSCLSGSDGAAAVGDGADGFLSCLSGSDEASSCRGWRDQFLSCLSGSDALRAAYLHMG